jgi:hypothetical protein
LSILVYELLSNLRLKSLGKVKKSVFSQRLRTILKFYKCSPNVTFKKPEIRQLSGRPGALEFHFFTDPRKKKKREKTLKSNDL